MTLEQLEAMLKQSGYPVVYRAWPESSVPPMPYICYSVSRSSNFAADGVVYFTASRIQAKLCTSQKDPDAEAAVEAALSSVVWKKTETYTDSIACYQITYEFEV